MAPTMLPLIVDFGSTKSSFLPKKFANDDLALLPEISEQILLNDLEFRYRQGQIYTSIGDILIALNPFESIPIYGEKISEIYKNAVTIPSLPPHIYACAERLYRNVLREKRSQCVIISGLSGSGKTESCKYIVQHILSRSHSIETTLNVKINQVNPLMEAFGNAKTYINDNSSRFGKYLEIHFSPTGNVLGANLKEYLLEKSRVVSHNSDEGNFHIFYYLFAGLSHEILLRNGLRIATDHRFMSHNLELAQLDGARHVEYRKKFQMVKQSLISIGFSLNDVQTIFTILSAILHIGDVTFAPHGSNDGVRVKNNTTIEKIAELLQVSSIEFSSALVTELQVTRGEQIFRERNLIQASECRDAFAKALYGRLFSWIVNGINSYLQPVEDQSNSESPSIAVLDIFGFENFKSNSFEQLCINLTNEHMQRFLNQHIYDLEIADCQKEGIETVDIKYTDNQQTIETFLNKHLGILAILDEESRFAHASDQSLATKLHHGPGSQFPEIYVVPKDSGTSFTIRHYAASVVYNIVGLLEKNRDFLPNSIVYVARTSNNVLIQELFRLNLNEKGLLPASTTTHPHHHHPNTFHIGREMKRTEPLVNQVLRQNQHLIRTLPEKNNGNTFERTGGTAMRTVAFHFKCSLTELIDKMNSSQCHFVRCIKPNEVRDNHSPFAIPSVTRQLRYSGVLQMCEIRKRGFPLRIQFDEFLQRYNALVVCLLPSSIAERSQDSSLQLSNRDRAIECLKRASIENFKIGKTKLLFRYWHSDQLHNLAVDYEKKVNVCQKVLRGWLARRKYARLREVHHLQIAFIRKFSDDISLTSQFYRTQMDLQYQFDQRRHNKQNPSNKLDEDDEQIEKTMNFFDSILDPYLNDQEIHNEIKNRQHSSAKPINQLNLNPVGQMKHEFDGNICVNSNTSSSSLSSSSSSSQKNGQRPSEINDSHFHQFQNIRCRFEQLTSSTNNGSSANNVRRYTSENNLNVINPAPKPVTQEKNLRSKPVQNTATSTEDLTKIPSWKKLSPQARLSALLDKTNHQGISPSLTPNGTSASLIDLTSIDKIATNQPIPPSTRPRFRFVPSSDQNSVLKEEPEPEQQMTSSHRNYDNFDKKPLIQNRPTPNNNSPSAVPAAKPTNGLVKPTVISPVSTTTQIRSTSFPNGTPTDGYFQHQNGSSAFRPPTNQPMANHMKSTMTSSNNAYPIQRVAPTSQNGIPQTAIINGYGAIHRNGQPPPVPQIKRTDSVHKPGVHVGITNPSGPSINNAQLIRQQQQQQQQQNTPQYHQSMLNLSSIGSSDLNHTGQGSNLIYTPRSSVQQNNSNSNNNHYMKHPAYTPLSSTTKVNGHTVYHPSSAGMAQTRSTSNNLIDDPILQWINQVNHMGSSNVLNVNASQSSVHSNGAALHRSQAPVHPYGSYIATGSGLPTSANNSSEQRSNGQGPYLNQVSVHKHHTPQHTVPVQSAAYLKSSAPVRNGLAPTSNGNIYQFNHIHAQPISVPSHGGGVQTRHPPTRPDVTVTTYL